VQFPLDGYIVHVRFDDGLNADVDLSCLVELGEVFKPLADLGFFRGCAPMPRQARLCRPTTRA
jgi:hypothetical protein